LRTLYGAAALICATLLGVALYLQHVQGIEPCPLCLIQRVVVIALGAVFLMAACHDPNVAGRRAYGLVTIVVAGLGVAVAGRHVWLQNLPTDEVPACGPGLEYILENFPLSSALDLVLRGSGECAEVVWSFLGLSIPGWTLLIFLGFLVFGLQQTLKPTSLPVAWRA
jgi:disulfide bond formation protein DsbB